MKPHTPSWRPIGGQLVRVDESPAGRDAARAHLQFLLRAATVDADALTGHYETGAVAHVNWRDVTRVLIRRAPPECEGVLFVDLVAEFGTPIRIVPWTELTGLPVGDPRIAKLVALICSVRPAVQLDAHTRDYLDGEVARPLESLQELALHDRELVPGDPYR